MPESKGPIVLTTQELEIARAIARDLAPDVDRNELGKALDYFRRVKDTGQFFELLERLPRSGYARSNRTRGYLRRITKVCQQYLSQVEDNGRILAIVGWSFRLMTYYQILIAAGVLEILTPFATKVGEETAKKLGEEIYRSLKQRFQNDRDVEASRMLENYMRKPQGYEDALLRVLIQRAQQNPLDFGNFLNLLAQRRRAIKTQ